MALEGTYSPDEIEKKWYNHWMEKDYFKSVPDDREPYTIVIPPPNVTGVLHMGHMLNITIQDILIRKARLEGKNACWVPGTDHASIATEAKVVKMLREKGIKKSDISREEFLKYAFEWKDKYGGIILQQLQKLGASADWSRTRFTMEEKLSKAVIQVFCDLHKKGKIYRKLRMTNWDPEAKTVLSNEEVIYTEENSQLYHVRYQIAGSEEYVTIATTRPETILGDSAVAVHPKDERYTHLHGKQVIVPMVNRTVPIIADRYVEMEFGTGALKVTPAHDMNDYEIGQRHNLETIDVFNADGTMSEAAGFYPGQDRFVVRKLIVKDLKAAGHIVEIENYRNKVGRSERTNAVIESRLTLQWFMDMKEMSKTAFDTVDKGEVKFFPEHFQNMYNNWVHEDNVRDWCISRQLWWGQQIPAYYIGEEIIIAPTPEEALEEAKKVTGNNELTSSDLRQDEDVLDTWFSSWLWPISVFDGFENQEELAYYYPTNVLVTGWDIIYLWVARMIMAGYEYSEALLGKDFVEKNGKFPFADVYFTGMVRDSKRRKMSKSLGNSPEALELIDRYGADGVRFGMLSSGAAGNDIIFDAKQDPKTNMTISESAKCEQGLRFCNKMWNGLKMLRDLEITKEKQSDEIERINQLAMNWIEEKYEETLTLLERQHQNYRLSDSLMTLYNFIWKDFFSEYLELIKPAYVADADGNKKQLALSQTAYDHAIDMYEKFMTVLHPFMPFVTEEIWHQLRDRKPGEDCILSTYPKAKTFDAGIIKKVDAAIDVISKVRAHRMEKGIKAHLPLNLFIKNTKGAQAFFAQAGLKEAIIKRAVIKELTFTDLDEIPDTVSITIGTEQFLLELPEATIDTKAELAKAIAEKERLEKMEKGLNGKLGNERFVNNAPAKVVELEKKKLADTQAKIVIVKEVIRKLGK